MGALSKSKQQQAIAANITSQPGLQQVQVAKGLADGRDSRRNSNQTVSSSHKNGTAGVLDSTTPSAAAAPYKNSLAAFAARQSELNTTKKSKS